MIVFESRHARRFVARFERGEDVVASLKKLAQSERIRAAWVRGTGLLEWVEITDWDPDREALRTPRRIEGPIALLSCEGNVSMRLGEPYVELRAALSREGDAGLQVLGGQLVVAAALNVEVVCEVFEDVRLDRDEERATGLSVWKGEHTAGVVARTTQRTGHAATTSGMGTSGTGSSGMGHAGPFTAGARPPSPARTPLHAPERPAPSVAEAEDPSRAGEAVSWSEVARLSAAKDGPGAPRGPEISRKAAAPSLVAVFDRPPVSAPRDDEEPAPKKGDWIDHRQFGLCRVDGEDVDGGLMIRLPSGTRKVVHTEMMDVLPPRFEGDRRIFPIRPRRKP